MSKRSVMDEKITSLIGEGVHASLRKFCDSPASSRAYRAIQEMPDKEWADVCALVAKHVLACYEKEGGWRPIEEAPKDEEVWIASWVDDGPGYWSTAIAMQQDDGWWSAHDELLAPPTYFQPLPLPPGGTDAR